MRINMSNVRPMGIAAKVPQGEVFGCIPHGRGAYVAAGDENYCGNLLWQSSVTLLPPDD